MPRRAVLDSSIAHAYLAEDDKHHQCAVEAVASLEEALVPLIVIHELVWGLRRRYGWQHAAALVEAFLAMEKVEPVPLIVEDVELGLSDARRYNDLLVVSTARRLNSPLLTLDRKMARIAERLGVEVLAPCGLAGEDLDGGRARRPGR